MKAKYLIRDGGSFRLPDGTIKGAGEEIELDSDVALAHPYSVELVKDEKAEKADPTTTQTHEAEPSADAHFGIGEAQLTPHP